MFTVFKMFLFNGLLTILQWPPETCSCVAINWTVVLDGKSVYPHRN